MGHRAITSCGLVSLMLAAGCGGSSSMPNTGGTSPQANGPVLTAIAPSSVAAGAPAITMSVYGSGFLAGAAAQWNGTSLVTTLVSPNQLTATVPVANLTSPGTAKVTVANPSPGGNIEF